jgi:hypothetical protein
VARRNVESNLLTLFELDRFGYGGRAYAGEFQHSALCTTVCRDCKGDW